MATKQHVEALHKTNFLLPDFKLSFDRAADNFMQKAEPLFSDFEYILLHGDCHKGNLIHRPGEGIYIVDFDDMSVAPPVQDCWMLMPDTMDKCENEIGWFLKGYELFKGFDRRSLKLIPALRGMRIIHFVSWLAVQSKEPDFTFHFPQVGTRKYWNEIINEVQEIVF